MNMQPLYQQQLSETEGVARSNVRKILNTTSTGVWRRSKEPILDFYGKFIEYDRGPIGSFDQRTEGEGKMTNDCPNAADEMMPIPAGLKPTAKSPIHKITWPQVGRVAEPGRYMFKFGWLTVTAEDIAVWEQYPTAEFTLFPTATTEAGEEFRLGTFDLRAYLSPSER
jgi:hypothetical protein